MLPKQGAISKWAVSGSPWSALEGKSVPQVPENKFTWTNLFRIDGRNALTVDVVYVGERYFGDDDLPTGEVNLELPLVYKLTDS